jgi:CheY-like chemotaxis protein
MYPAIDDKYIKKNDPSSIRILLADAHSAKVSQVIAFAEPQFQVSIRLCESYFDLMPMLNQELPDLLLLGVLDRFNSLDTCLECHQRWATLPIILLSRQNAIDDYFRKLAISRGATDIVSNDLLQLDRLLRELPQSPATNNSPPNISAPAILAAMKEIAEIGTNYFGPLAQGNYWRKSHARTIGEYPSLQNWSADHFGIVNCEESLLTTPITADDLHSLQKWVGEYIRECERIIIDFGDILGKSNLSSDARHLLPHPASSPKNT